MCLPKRCERLKTYFIIILSSTCAAAAASSSSARLCARQLWFACAVSTKISVPISRLYLMAVFVHGRLGVSNTRRIAAYVACSRPSFLRSSLTFLICLVRRWIFPIILAFPSVKFIHDGAMRLQERRWWHWKQWASELYYVVCSVGWARKKKNNNNNHTDDRRRVRAARQSWRYLLRFRGNKTGIYIF